MRCLLWELAFSPIIIELQRLIDLDKLSATSCSSYTSQLCFCYRGKVSNLHLEPYWSWGGIHWSCQFPHWCSSSQQLCSGHLTVLYSSTPQCRRSPSHLLLTGQPSSVVLTSRSQALTLWSQKVSWSATLLARLWVWSPASLSQFLFLHLCPSSEWSFLWSQLSHFWSSC